MKELALDALSPGDKRKRLLNLLEVLAEGESFTVSDLADLGHLLGELPSGALEGIRAQTLSGAPGRHRLRLTRMVASNGAEGGGCCGLCGGQ